MTADSPTSRLSTGLSGIRFEGPDTASFLHGQLSTDVEAMPVGDARWTTYNSPKGRLLATPLLWRRGEAEFIAYVPADIAESLAKRLRMFVLRAKVKVELRSGRALTGHAGPLPDAPAPGRGIATGERDVVTLPDGRVLVDIDQAIANPGDDGSTAQWDWLGVRAGVPQITAATQDLFVPQTANLDLVGGINFRKGCYPGQEIVARMQYLGRLKERLFAFHAEGAPPLPGTRIVAGEDNVGTVVNAAAAPDGGSDLLAVVSFAAVESGGLHVAGGVPIVPIALPYGIPAPAAPNRVKL